VIGITGIYPYIPRYRIKLETIDQAWNRPKKKGERALGNFDEDGITMAVQTLSGIRKEWDDIDSIIFSTTSSPFVEGSAASLLAYVLGAKEDCQTIDLNQSLRSGTTGLGLAFDLAKKGAADSKNGAGKRKTLVVAADRRKADTGSELERNIADGACAIEIGSDRAIARLAASSSQHDFIYDIWQRSTDSFLQQGDGKFSSEQMIESIVKAGKRVLEQGNKTAESIQWIVVTTDQPKLHQAVAKKLGFPSDRLIGNRISNEVGFTGVSAPFLALNEALLQCEKGDNILLLQYGSGADGFLFEVTDEIDRFQAENDLGPQLSNKIMVEHYNEWLIRRETIKREDLAPYSTPVYVKRERENNLRLRGQKCTKCESIHFPERRNCLTCRSREEMEWIWLERTGTVYTFTHDHLFPGEIGPTTMAVVDLDGGGRVFTQMTDLDSSRVKIGERVRLSFRKIHEGGGFPNYYWKAVPMDGREGAEG
jgi:hydroxymethylglutaryl-CoA synthase